MKYLIILHLLELRVSVMTESKETPDHSSDIDVNLNLKPQF